MAVDTAWSRQLATADRLATSQTPYLPIVGAPAIRFVAPPPDLVTRPPAAAPPQPRAEAPTRPDVILAEPANEPTSEPAVASVEPDASTPPPSPAPARIVPPILVDELRPRVRAEDFLPYFQIPAEHEGDVNVIVPVPRGTTNSAPLPTSSATYSQSPR